jgi:hypothetical protein
MNADRDPIDDLRHDISEPDNDGTVLVQADDVAALLARMVPDGHTRIDNVVYRVTMFDQPSLNGNQAWLVPVEQERD